MDSFHIIISTLLGHHRDDLEKERIFDTLFALLDLGVNDRVASPSTTATPPTPFLDLPLIADYHHTYNTSERLPRIFNEDKSERDPRLDPLETSLSSLLSGVKKKDPGVLNIVLRSRAKTNNAVKPASIPAPIPSTSDNEEESAASIESKTAQILGILPHLSPPHVSRLLQDDRSGGNVERVLEGLLDGGLGFECEGVDEDEAPGERRRVSKGSNRRPRRATVDMTLLRDETFQ